jgi:hypothetical protein
MKALSLTQPFASLVALGQKKVETRSWAPYKYMLGQTIAIHASKKFPTDAQMDCYLQDFFLPLWPDLLPAANHIQSLPISEQKIRYAFGQELEKRIKALPLGCVLATATLTGFWSTDSKQYDYRKHLSEQEITFGNYAPNRYMWFLDNVQMLPEPIPAKGALGFWEWNEKSGQISK